MGLVQVETTISKQKGKMKEARRKRLKIMKVNF